MEKQRYILGIDGGGTKTDLVVANEQGEFLAKVKVGPSNLHNSTQTEIISEWKRGLMSLFKKTRLSSHIKFDAVAAGIAGLDSPHDLAKAKRIVKGALGKRAPKGKRLQVVNDTVIGFWSAGDHTYGIGIVGGTGSNAYARNKRGKEAWASGMGHILTDEGGGYWIGSQVLRAAVKSADGRGRKTLLEKMVLKHFKVKSIRELIIPIYYKPFTKHDRGELAYLLELAALKGDKVAQQIARDAGDELSLMVKAVGSRVGFKKSEQFELVMIGGVVQKDPYVTRRFKSEVKKLYPKVKFIIPKEKPVWGAVRMGMESLKS